MGETNISKTIKSVQTRLQKKYAMKTVEDTRSLRDDVLKEEMLEMSFQRILWSSKGMGKDNASRTLCMQSCERDVEKLCLSKVPHVL